eukprot:scaffold68297_cov120-Phaeocystis_antarctica.AAC.2
MLERYVPSSLANFRVGRALLTCAQCPRTPHAHNSTAGPTCASRGASASAHRQRLWHQHEVTW